MTAGVVILLVALFLIMDGVVIGSLFYAFAHNIARPLAESFPARQPLPEAVRREFQSFSFDMFNFGGCLHAAVDDEHLHIQPALVSRWIGMKPVSIPWEAITIAPARKRSRTLKATVRSGTRSWTVRGPRWCLELAAPPASVPPAA